MIKKIVSMLLALCMCFSLCTTAFAVDSWQTEKYSAQILRVKNPNKYGTDIYDKSTYLPNIPISVSQNEGSLRVSLCLDEKTSFSINADIRGRNVSNSILFYDAASSSDKYEVMSLTYVDTQITKRQAFCKEYFSNKSPAASVLNIYLKETGARNYYFIEVFNFDLPSFSDIMSIADCADADYWYVAEFLPTSIQTIENDVNTNNQVALASTTHTYTTYNNWTLGADTIRAALKYSIEDDITNIAANASKHWKSRLTIVDKYSTCSTNELYNSNDSKLYIGPGTYYKINAPVNARIFSTQLDGNVSSGLGSVSGEIGVKLGALSISVDPLTAIMSLFGTTKLRVNYTSYPSNSNSCAKAVSIEIPSKYYLMSVGSYYEMEVVVNADGNPTSNYSTIKSIWGITFHNSGSNSGYSVTKYNSYSRRVT